VQRLPTLTAVKNFEGYASAEPLPYLSTYIMCITFYGCVGNKPASAITATATKRAAICNIVFRGGVVGVALK